MPFNGRTILASARLTLEPRVIRAPNAPRNTGLGKVQGTLSLQYDVRMDVDLLAFGPHPDDLEIGMGGTLALHADLGARVGLCDLTRGEMSSNGTPEERAAEAARAAAVVGARWRENLGLPDGGLAVVPEQVIAIVELIRRARPRVVAIPHARDRHPDHLEPRVGRRHLVRLHPLW